MGKEWHIGGGRSSRRVPAATATDYRRNRPSLPGCMSTLFRFFDFHSYHITTRFLFNKHHRQHSPPKPSHHGVEASRNSLELDEAPNSCLRNKEENFHIQMGLQIKTSRNGCKNAKASQQQLPNIDHIASESPSAKTPNLLARLMGLDILPQTSSRPRPNTGACHNVSGTRSLPESPRVSSGRLSDVDRHHRRFSLQISFDKENIKISEEEHEKERARRKDIALIDITNSDRKLEYGEQEVRFSRSKVEKPSKRLKKMVADESSSKFINLEPLSMSMSMPMPNPKAKLQEEEAFRYRLLNNLNSPTIFSVRKGPSPAAEMPHEKPWSYYPKGNNKQASGDGGEITAAVTIGSSDGGAVELEYTATVKEAMRHQCNTRLLFHEVEKVRESVEEFTRANCYVVGEIDALIEKDLRKWSLDKMMGIEGIVKLVELHIFDSLVWETIVAIVHTKRGRFLADMTSCEART